MNDPIRTIINLIKNITGFMFAIGVLVETKIRYKKKRDEQPCT